MIASAPPARGGGVLLVSMPFVGIDRPSLGLSLLQAQLQRAGVSCRTRYFTFAFAEFIGLDEYVWICDELPYTAFVGDWLFASQLHGPRVAEDMEYVEQTLVGEWQLAVEDVRRILRARSYTGHFLDHCLAAERWEDHPVVGFTSTFTQNIASLALAKRIKDRHPETTIVFGGANWEGEMGQALHERFEFVDYAFSGEADETFPALVAGLGRPGFDPAEVPGIVYRREGRSVATPPASLVVDMDGLPYPDYDDYMEDFLASPAAAGVTPNLLLETSRGCWWGAKAHCTFCGLNGGTMSFRSKSAERALAEIDHLRKRYRTDRFEVVDNILDMRYFKTLLPRLAEEDFEVDLFYEIKANLTREQVGILADAGVRVVQPGIESFSDHVLELMRKGTTGLQNIQLLKWCKEHGVRVEWNLLYGFPGETAADYEEMLPLVEAIWFLDPPSGYGPVRLDRFSPYHTDPAAYGMINVRSMSTYRHLYPFDEATRSRIAYYFDYDLAEGRDVSEHAKPLIARIEEWQRDQSRGSLTLLAREDGAVIVDDSRANRPRRKLLLEGWRGEVYRACDRIATRARLLDVGRAAGAEEAEVDGFLALCLKLDLMVERSEKYLALALDSRPAALEAPGRALPLPRAEPLVERAP